MHRATGALPSRSQVLRNLQPACNQSQPFHQVIRFARLQVWTCFTNGIGVPRAVSTHNLSTKFFPG
jgi:hypothetical protein